jgi:hypothetical protein
MKTQIHTTARYLGVLFMMILLPASLFSQQVIRFKSGNEYLVKIVYASNDTVRYEALSSPGVTSMALMSEIRSITPYTGPVYDKSYWQAKYDRNQRKMYAGIGLCAIGLIMDVAGIVKISNAGTDEWGFPQYSRSGVTLTTLGIPVMVIGSIIATVGGGQMKKCSKKLKGFSVDLNASPAISGATIRYKF